MLVFFNGYSGSLERRPPGIVGIPGRWRGGNQEYAFLHSLRFGDVFRFWILSLLFIAIPGRWRGGNQE